MNWRVCILVQVSRIQNIVFGDLKDCGWNFPCNASFDDLTKNLSHRKNKTWSINSHHQLNLTKNNRLQAFKCAETDISWLMTWYSCCNVSECKMAI